MTLAIVDDSTPPSSGEWDPSDPAAVQLADGSWGVAYTDAASPANTLYRRYLGAQDPPYRLDAVTVDTGASSVDTPVPAMVTFGSNTTTLALFYRKATGSASVKQVFLRTSTDYWDSWSSATQLTTESVDVYHIQAYNDSGTVYLFWSLSNTSGTLQYETSTNLSSWSGVSTVGQAIGPLQSSAYPSFDIKKLNSGTWALTWLNVDTYCAPNPPPSPCTSFDRQASNSLNYPVVWYGTSSSLSASSWSNVQELTLPYTNAWPNGLSLAQTSAGTVYVSYTRNSYPVGSRSRYTYYATSTDDGAIWSGRWSDATLYGYEPSRATDSWSGVFASNSYLVVDGSGNIRSFWDQYTANGWYTFPDNYPTQLFRRDLPSGAIIPVSATKEVLSQCSVCVPWAAFGAGPVNLTTGNFTLPETDVSIPARGPGLAFQRSYNSLRLVDGTLGYTYLRARYYGPVHWQVCQQEPFRGRSA